MGSPADESRARMPSKRTFAPKIVKNRAVAQDEPSLKAMWACMIKSAIPAGIARTVRR